jgi:hypothetical protein
MAIEDNPLFTAKCELKPIYLSLLKENRFKTVKTKAGSSDRSMQWQIRLLAKERARLGVNLPPSRCPGIFFEQYICFNS